MLCWVELRWSGSQKREPPLVLALGARSACLRRKGGMFYDDGGRDGRYGNVS